MVDSAENIVAGSLSISNPVKNNHSATKTCKTSEMYARPINDTIHLTDDIIPLKHFTNPHTKNMLDITFTGDDNSQYFANLRNHNYSATAQISYVPLWS